MKKLILMVTVCGFFAFSANAQNNATTPKAKATTVAPATTSGNATTATAETKSTATKSCCMNKDAKACSHGDAKNCAMGKDAKCCHASKDKAEAKPTAAPVKKD